MKHQTRSRILSFFLCAAVTVTVLLLCVFAVTNEEFAITSNGEIVEKVVFSQDAKTQVALQGVPNGAELQWQIRMTDGETWVDISDQTGETLTLSYALVASIMDGLGTTAVRCVATVDGAQVATGSVTVQMAFVAKGTGQQQTLYSVQQSALTYNSGTGTDTLADNVQVVVHYKYLSVDGTPVFDSWVADLERNVPLNQTVTSPKTQGYEPNRLYLAGYEEDTVLDLGDSGTITMNEDGSVTFDLKTVPENMEVTVVYEPLLVEYTVEYYIQNVADDLYTHHSTVIYKGYAGTRPDDKKNQGIAGQASDFTTFEIDGFTRLYYLPEEIAADGSTEFKCYFDRNYYLINFELEGGFGVAPVYARYEDSLVVGEPVKPGYIFDGWDLKNITITNADNQEEQVKTHIVNGVETEIPYNNPARDPLPPQIGKCGHGDPLVGNYTFAAIWASELTTYTVVYWLQDGSENTFLGSRVEYEMSGKKVSGSDDLGQGAQICGHANHPAHTEGCYSTCSKTRHIHSVDKCQTDCTHTHTIDCCGTEETRIVTTSEMAAIQAMGKNEPQQGYIYVFYVEGTRDHWLKLYMGKDDDGNDLWYHSIVERIAEGSLNNPLGEGTAGTYTVKKYNADLSYYGCDHVHGEDCFVTCERNEHIHTQDCMPCGKTAHTHHVHDASCYFYWDNGGASDNDKEAIKAIFDGNEPESGYIYVVTVNGQRYPKLYVNGEYYGAHDIEIVGDAIGKVGEYTSSDNVLYTARQYKTKTHCGYDCSDCTQVEHSHEGEKITCRLELHTHSVDCTQETKHMNYLRAEENILVDGDGSSVVNVYYEYKEYTLRFYYAASKTEGTGDSATTTYYVIGGSTYYFGYTYGSNTDDDTTLLENMFDKTDERGQVAADNIPQLNADGQALVDQKIYTEGTLSGNEGWTYHFISFKARYGDDISEKWPVGVFDSVKMASGYYNSGWGQPYAVVSAWNGEHHVKYSQTHGNETIKGKYEKLDDQLLFNTGYEDAAVVSYLCFWENGAARGWNIPELYRYKIWIEARPGELNEDLTHIDSKTPTVTYDGVTYKLVETYDTCDNSTVGEQTQTVLTGYEPVYFPQNARSGYSYEQVQGKPDKYFEYIKLTDAAVLKDKDGNKIYSQAFEVNFYYKANRHKIVFWNYNRHLHSGQGSTVMYGTPLATHGQRIDATYMEDYYPDDLEPGAYVFAGWYTTASCAPNTAVDWANLNMPDSDMQVYAYWAPKEWKVQFFEDYEKYEQYNQSVANGNPDSSLCYASDIGVLHNSEILNENRPADPKREGYTFAGWFYYNERGKKVAFNIHSMAVQQDMQLFAEWVSQNPVTYTVHYKDENGNDIAEPTEGYSFAGYTRTVTSKLGTALNPGYQAGYFPLVSSHSILMKENAADNTYTFYYNKMEEVEYTVRYVIAGSMVELADSKQELTKNAIVTETAKLGTELNKAPEGKTYIPQSYTEQLILSADGTKNVITFYYVAVDNTGAFIIHYRLQNVDGTAYVEHTETYYATAEQGQMIDALGDSKYQKSFVGFTLENTEERKKEATNIIETGKVVHMYLYYSRNSYDYKVQYMIVNTTTELLEAETGAAKFGAEVTREGYATLTYQDIQYKLVTVGSRSITISDQEQNNVITFYYEPIKTVLQIEVQGLAENCTDTFLFKVEGPTELYGKDSYIELIVAVQGNGVVTIGEMSGYSQVLVGLYAGTYKVTALTTWSYSYELQGAQITEGGGTPSTAADAANTEILLRAANGNKIVFTYKHAGTDWLGAETSKDNEFAQKYQKMG